MPAELISTIIIVLIAIVVTRFIFSIDSFIQIGKTCIGLLIIIAKKNGATTEEIDEVLDRVWGKTGKKKVQ